MEQYFATGLLLDTKTLKTQCPSLRVIGQATLSGYRLGFPLRSLSGHGLPGLILDERAEIEGVSCEVPRDELRTLDAQLCVPEIYRRRRVQIRHGGHFVRAWTHLANPVDDGSFQPTEETVSTLFRCGQEHGLPSGYFRNLINELHPWIDTYKTRPTIPSFDADGKA